MEPGLNDGGFLVCKFIFRVSSEGFSKTSRTEFLQRLPGQPSLQRHAEGETDDGDSAISDEDTTVLPVEDASD